MIACSSSSIKPCRSRGLRIREISWSIRKGLSISLAAIIGTPGNEEEGDKGLSFKIGF